MTVTAIKGTQDQTGCFKKIVWRTLGWENWQSDKEWMFLQKGPLMLIL